MTREEYKHERTHRGLTQAALAKLLGVARETITRRETGEVEITREMEIAICALPPAAKHPDHR